MFIYVYMCICVYNRNLLRQAKWLSFKCNGKFSINIYLNMQGCSGAS